MELINQIIMMVMMSFMAIAAVDRILNQFGGAEAVLGRIGLGALGRNFAGSGAQFEEGFMAMGALGLAMVGVFFALLCNVASLWSTYEYGKDTTRGPSELTIAPDGSSAASRWTS